MWKWFKNLFSEEELKKSLKEAEFDTLNDCNDATVVIDFNKLTVVAIEREFDSELGEPYTVVSYLLNELIEETFISCSLKQHEKLCEQFEERIEAECILYNTEKKINEKKNDSADGA